MRVGVLDVGTNTVRLLVTDGDRQFERASVITRLGEGVDATGELGEEPMRRTLEAVAGFVDMAREAGAVHLRIAGTSALRDARNASVFVERVERACGIRPDVLTGPAEGALAYAGATRALPEGSYVVCDIGGGSTELISREAAVSADVGAVRVRERFLDADPPSAGALDAARRGVADELARAGAGAYAGAGELVGVAATITTIAALDAGLQAYDPAVVHGYRLSADRVRHWSSVLNGMSAEGIKGLGPVAPGRADVIGAGALVLDVVVGVLGAQALTASEDDILDGLADDLLG